MKIRKFLWYKGVVFNDSDDIAEMNHKLSKNKNNIRLIFLVSIIFFIASAIFIGIYYKYFWDTEISFFSTSCFIVTFAGFAFSLVSGLVSLLMHVSYYRLNISKNETSSSENRER